MSADPQLKRARRAEPITKHKARNGAVTYNFRVDVGIGPDGTRLRQQFTYATLAEARREYRRITTEVAAGTFVQRDKTTVAAFLAGWLDGRRDVRPGTLAGYRHALKPVIDHLGAVPLQHLRTADLDALVALRMAGKPVAQRDKRGRRSAEVLTWLRARPDGASYGEMYAEFGNAGEKALARLMAAGEVTRPARGDTPPPGLATPSARRWPVESARARWSPCWWCCRRRWMTRWPRVSSPATSPGWSSAPRSRLPRWPPGHPTRPTDCARI